MHDFQFRPWPMGIEVIDLRPDIFQIACGYFSLIINHYLFPASFRHNISQSLGMTGVHMYCSTPSLVGNIAAVHTTLYGSAVGCRSIQKTCAFWKHGLTFENTQESVDIFLQIKYQPNIHQRQWYDMRSHDCNFYRNQTLGRRIDHLFVFFWPQKLVVCEPNVVQLSGTPFGDVII